MNNLLDPALIRLFMIVVIFSISISIYYSGELLFSVISNGHRVGTVKSADSETEPHFSAVSSVSCNRDVIFISRCKAANGTTF